MNIVNPLNFNRELRPAVQFIVEHTHQYSIMPEPVQVKASTGIDIDCIPEMNNEGHIEFFLTEFEKFTRRQELERAILKSAELLEKGEFDPVEKLIKDAVQISLMRDLGIDYFGDPKERLNRYFNQGGQVSTGWPQLDRIMYGGMSRGELVIMAGGSGSGKSLVMMNLALNFLRQGLNGVYVTLELSEELTSLRTDAMLTAMSTKDIRKDLDNVELKVKLAAKKSGKYRVKNLPAQSNVNAIRSYIKEVQIQTDMPIDFVMVDYLDLVMPVTVKVNPNDQFIKDKYVSEELRNLAKELGVIMVTASQLNRSSVEETEFDHSHIAGGISKINTADYVFGIFTSRSMRERGKYQIQCMKSRSSTGVGNKIELDYNIDTMRITDSNPDQDSSRESATSIMSKIRPVNSIITPTETINTETGEIVTEYSKVKATVEGTKLKNLLHSLKKN
jgi:KaiC/GvpD/RAD55 family RecA-like ATPase